MPQRFLSKEGYQRLQNELQYLKTYRRKEIADRLRAAQDQGDLAENAEFAQAKEEQGYIEGQIAQIKATLRNAVIINQVKNSKVISLGSKVKVKSNGKKLEYILVGSDEADPSQGKISNESPLGKALLGHKKGEVVEVTTHEGIKKYKILSVES